MARRGTVLTGLAAAGLYLSATAAAMAQNDPPDQVGRLAQVSGTVSFHTAEDNQWSPASLNYPITNGNSLWTEPRSHAAVDVGSSRIYMDSSTELDVGTIDDQHFVASVPQGAVYARIDGNNGSQYEIDTPRGQVLINQPGNYEVIAGDADHPTMVTVYSGLAQVTGPSENLSVGPGQSASIAGQDNQFQVSTGQAAPPDDFIQFVQDKERPYANQPSEPYQSSQQYGSPEMTGYQDLAPYGAWQSTPSYGPVWYPQVPPGWAPYRYGHWAYVWPWGWTWIDDAPWGFAPFHYGRWVDYDGRWGWVPGAYEPRPVYSPALVAFFGNFGGISLGIAIGQAVGWVPLGPGEICYPSYRASPDYMRRMNVAYIQNTTIINYNYYNSPHGQDYGHYKNHLRGATMVSSEAMVHSQSIGQAWKKIPQGNSNASWQHAKSFGGAEPIKPSFTTAGVTAGTAHHIGLTTTGTPNFRRAPGPQIQHNKNFNTVGANGQGNTVGTNGQGNAAGSNGQGGNNLKGQTGGQNSLTGTNRGTTTNAPSNGSKVTAPGPTITNNGTITNGTQGNQTGSNNSKKPKTFNTQGTTTNGYGTQGNQTGGGNSNKPKTFNTQGNTTTNGNGAQGGNNQSNTTHQNFGTGQNNQTGTVHTNNASGTTSGQQFNNQQNGQIHTNNGGGNPPPPPKSNCQAGTKCN